MRKLVPLLFLLLPACGMKGDLYQPAPTGTEATNDADKGDRKTIPSTPDPAQSQ